MTRSTIAPDAGLSADSIPTLTAAYEALAAVKDSITTLSSRRCGRRWSTGLGLKPRLAFGPVRAAVTGRRISPPLFESMELLGRESTLARIAAALTELGEPAFAGSSQTPGSAPVSTPGE